jgi:hypothetical protein
VLRTNAPAAGVNGRGAVTDAVADASLTVAEPEGCDGDDPELHAAVTIAIAPQKTENRFISLPFMSKSLLPSSQF